MNGLPDRTNSVARVRSRERGGEGAELPRRSEPVAAPQHAPTLSGLGNVDQAFEWLEKSYQERAGLLVFLKVEPIFDPLRSDPRFTELLRRLHLSP